HKDSESVHEAEEQLACLDYIEIDRDVIQSLPENGILDELSTSFISMRQRQTTEDGLATMAFPTLFPYGKGDPTNRARQHESETTRDNSLNFNEEASGKKTYFAPHRHFRDPFRSRFHQKYELICRYKALMAFLNMPSQNITVDEHTVKSRNSNEKGHLIRVFVSSLKITNFRPDENELRNIQLCYIPSLTTQRVIRAIIPIKVRSKETNKTIVTYAFLNNGSDLSFCTESLAEHSIIQQLEVSDLDENCSIDLPLIYTAADIPVTSKDIPDQEDVDQWPHLQGVQLPIVDAQIGILIASDVPKALDPLEVRNSENGGPYATRTLLGWAINGPLFRQNKSQGIGSFFFMASVRNTATLKNGHYVIALPFKNNDHQISNNKEQVVQRAHWLKQKLLKKPKLFEDYKVFIDNLLNKSYARKVPPERLCKSDGKVRYIPHHGVYHPHKPGKVRVVFDCSCKYKDPEEYQMLVHVFGAASSPSCSNFALLKTAEDNEAKFDSDVINIVKRNFYVDDCLKSTPTVSRAVPLVQDLRNLLTKGGFHLTKWISNSRELLASIPKEERAKQVKDLDLDQDKLPIERALGIQWSAESDKFCFKIVIKERPPTRRGMTADKFLKSNSWINGPDFLWQPRSSWPERPVSLQPNEVPSDDPELKRDISSCITEVHKPSSKEDTLLNLLQRISSWYRATKFVAWILHYRRKLIEAARKRKEKSCENKESSNSVKLTVDELKAAEKVILRCVQQKYFPEEIAVLQKQKSKQACIKKSSPLSKLDPIFQDDLLLVGGRLRHAPIPEYSKHPVILPKGIHRIYASTSTKWKAPVLEQKMADLPKDRLTPDHPPFTYVGVDYFGPFHVRCGRSLVKRYGVIFTCLVIRAVHIEISHSLDTDSFILALRRFLARRGQVKELRSDNGTNFTSGEKELREAISNWNQDKIHGHLLQKHIKWTFNPPYGSHHGGIWERCIRTIRSIMRALLKEQVINDEGLHTMMCEVEALMNARPITKVSDDPRDLHALTPNHLLLTQSNQPLPPGVFSKTDIYSKRRWRQFAEETKVAPAKTAYIKDGVLTNNACIIHSYFIKQKTVTISIFVHQRERTQLAAARETTNCPIITASPWRIIVQSQRRNNNRYIYEIALVHRKRLCFFWQKHEIQRCPWFTTNNNQMQISSMENLIPLNGSLLKLTASCEKGNSKETHCVLLKLESLPPYSEVINRTPSPSPSIISTGKVTTAFSELSPTSITSKNPQKGAREEESESGGTNAAAIAVTVTLLLVALALPLGYLIYYRRRKKRAEGQQTNTNDIGTVNYSKEIYEDPDRIYETLKEDGDEVPPNQPGTSSDIYSNPDSNMVGIPVSTEQEYTYANNTYLPRSSVGTKPTTKEPIRNGAVYETLEQPGQMTDDDFYNYPDNTNIANPGSSELEYIYAKDTDLPRATANTKAVRERDIEPATCGGLYHTLEQEGPASTEQEYSYAKNTDMPSIFRNPQLTDEIPNCSDHTYIDVIEDSSNTDSRKADNSSTTA
ncbi:Tyrosine kinase receptor Cad96Ca, partial [Paramuricea clavata]